MSPFVGYPRAPQATPSPSSSTSAAASTSTGSSPTSTTWDTRVGSQIFSTYQPAATQTSTSSNDSQQSGGILASKGAVAGLCVGIAILCILLIGFFIYRVKFKQPPVLAKSRTSKSSPFPPSSVARSSKQPPSTFQLGSRARHPLEDGVSRSASQISARSLHPSHISSSRGPGTERSYRAGDVMEIAPIGYQHTNSSVTPSVSASAYNSTRRTSEGGMGAGALISEYRPYRLPSRSLERLSSATGTASHTSIVDSGSYTSRSHLLLQSQIIPTTTETRANPSARPLPEPPHPPPAYEQVSSSRPLHILSPIQSVEKGRVFFADADPLTGSTLASMQLPNAQMLAHRKSSSLGDRQSAVPSLDAGVIPVLSSQTPSTLRTNPASLRRGDDGPAEAEAETALDMETAMTPHSHRRHPSSGDHDPFSNMNYELPAWLSSDPYPAPTLRPSASQPSLYGAVARSVAASSRVLPSDSSMRTLTPEPTSPPLPPLPIGTLTPSEQQWEAAHRRYSLAPTYRSIAPSTAPSTRPLSAIEGDGPPVDELLVFHGAERPGWAEHSPFPSAKASTSRNRRQYPTDRFEAEDFHPAAPQSRKSHVPSSPTTATATATGLSGSRSADREVTFMSLSPLSEVGPVQGLSRAFSLDAPQRRGYTPRARGRVVSRSPMMERSFSNFSSLQGARTGTSFGLEENGWPEHDQVLPSAPSTGLLGADERGRFSMVPSSNVLPADVLSIRSISPEIGWMDYPGTAEAHGNELEAIREVESSPNSAPTTAAVNDEPAATNGSGRASRMSIGEDGILWGRLTSAMEQEQQ